jgi:hypothetical protein
MHHSLKGEMTVSNCCSLPERIIIHISIKKDGTVPNSIRKWENKGLISGLWLLLPYYRYLKIHSKYQQYNTSKNITFVVN